MNTTTTTTTIPLLPSETTKIQLSPLPPPLGERWTVVAVAMVAAAVVCPPPPLLLARGARGRMTALLE
jgi:hypothetical protein